MPDALVLELRDVRVRHGGKAILDGVNWTVRRGERWAILGPNGAGKTTLLALACGDHPQAFSNDVRLFGTRRGSGETIWEVKRNIGFVSPEFHLYFREALTAFEAAATAFGDSLLYRAPTAEQAEAIRTVFAAFGCEALLDRKFARLSVGEQRLALLVRAVVKRPPLLILDEPFQGLDGGTVDRVRDWLDATLRPDQTLVFVTHVPAHLPRSVAHRLHLANGRVVG
jgi:molybdate transport system ATP-binding protein